ncbi:MAG: hypothetical protein A2161_15205 [Candidatus Schekmanbacteria bacterium RBG_13_48_7]|uniref:Putative heavy-metal chelation domain-containing protein n=1 Tax=Candidatus Schekmanbacteria bacterium RBG_13_48_7 TaxID=1817878 RepID=A0A1F7RXW5_9BACT|nr:MAG: hypothetical protein A2161_15205 [Candidatus Schekmanbacteria bacterium RBG_13_48_7]
MLEIYNKLKNSLREHAEKNDLFGKKVAIKFKTLTPTEAIGNPEDQDYPIIKGKEKMVEAEFEGCKGQAFTDEYGNASYTIHEILDLELNSNRKRAEFIATFNAVYRYLGLCDKTVHCRDSEPGQCGRDLLKVIDPDKKILLVGLQPRLLEAIASRQEIRVIDLDPDNTGKVKFGITVETEDKTSEGIKWCDELFVTGSTIVNGTIDRFLNIGKPVTFFGVTISAPAVVLDLNTYCSLGH